MQDLFYLGPFYPVEFPPAMEYLVALDLDLEFKQVNFMSFLKYVMLVLKEYLVYFYCRRIDLIELVNLFSNMTDR